LASMANLFTLPLLLLSGVLLPLTFAPQWMRTIADVNPLAYAIDASRALVSCTTGDPSVLIGFGAFAVLTALFAYWVTRSIRHAVA
ncbi:MAG: ABC transporter permease, partial [Anaerolineae bacterium]|nr:ABC transporter permease [Anaerolineae bacterium]